MKGRKAKIVTQDGEYLGKIISINNKGFIKLKQKNSNSLKIIPVTEVIDVYTISLGKGILVILLVIILIIFPLYIYSPYAGNALAWVISIPISKKYFTYQKCSDSSILKLTR